MVPLPRRDAQGFAGLVALCFYACALVDVSAWFLGKKAPGSFPLPPDTRPDGCDEVSVDPHGNNFEGLLVSIIIPYRREKWDHILGSVESILYFTPADLIGEILFVSDGNGPEEVHLELLRALSPVISVLVLPMAGEGLISAKMRAVGATLPASSVIVFLEPHIRVNQMWLQALLARIRRHPHVLAMPALDLIPQDNFRQYLKGTKGHWRFEWNLNLIFTNPYGTNEVSRDPWASPATSGGIFAIRKDYWNQLGLYDAGMIGWGGDHIEATLKVWRCGGHIEIVPCSRIGHLFRDPAHRPYDVEVKQVVHNYGRIAEVWLDDYRSYFLKMKPEVAQMDLGDLSHQHALRDRLRCHNMSWYLENVDREMFWEKDHICIPCQVGKQHPLCCKGAVPPGRSTVDHVMPIDEYRPLQLPIDDADPSEFEL